MRWSLVQCTLAVVVVACVAPEAGSTPYARALGDGAATTIALFPDRCSGTLSVHHDSSFESAYAWESHAAEPEYEGAWGEAYDFGPCQVVCGAYWLTALPIYYYGDPANLYIWEGGVTGEPGAVLLVLPDVVFQNVPFWPQIGENDVPIGIAVDGEFTIGFWGNWIGPQADFFIASDENGAGGRPWTYVSPDTGVPTGWNHVADIPIFRECRSLGIGVYYDDTPTPVDATSWSRVKLLYR